MQSDSVDRLMGKNKGKDKETRTPPIKLELEKDDEYNEESAIKIGKTLEETLEKITDEIDKNREMERKRIELDNEEIRTWAENIEDHENIDKKVINTPEILLSSTESNSSFSILLLISLSFSEFDSVISVPSA